jgi:hypothetical protein
MRRPAGPLVASAAAIAASVSACPASAAAGDTIYGGAAHGRHGPPREAVTLVRHADGRLTGRVGTGYACGSHAFPNLIIHLSGAPNGDQFTASGSVRLTRRARLRVTLKGVIAPDAVAGTLRVRIARLGRCRGFARTLVLRTAAAPSGALTRPAGGALLLGLTAQSVAGVRLPIALKVTPNGTALHALWEARMHCGPRAAVSLVNVSPTIAVDADGTFAITERFSAHYRDGSVDRYIVTLRGAFLTDGAAGTFRARMQTHAPGRRYRPCDSGARRWTARV